MGPAGTRDPLKFNTAGCIVLPAALFIALMLATAGAAIWPPMAAPGAAILCGSGELDYESHGASYRPGEYIVSREIYCRSGTGKAAARDEITFQAMGVSFLIYAAAIFLLLQFVARPLAARRLRRRMEALGIGAPAPPSWPGSPAPPSGLGDVLTQLQAAMRRGEADLRSRHVSAAASELEIESGDFAARLAQLKALRDQGLITAEDYEARKAEILSEL